MFHREGVFVCAECGGWLKDIHMQDDKSKGFCVDCEETMKSSKVAERVEITPKWCLNGVGSISDIADFLEGWAEVAREYEEEGFWLEDSPADGHGYLQKEVDNLCDECDSKMLYSDKRENLFCPHCEI